MNTTDKPLVSVLMTAYNRERYIADAMRSVLSSTYENLELLIVDDGSKDQTLAIAQSFADKDNRVKIHRNEKNLGDYPNRNHAAFLASGKYLKYVDSDDYIYPWALEILVNCMESFPEAGWGLCSMEHYIEKPFPFVLSPKEVYEYHYTGPGLFRRAPLSSIIRKDAFVAVGGFRPIRMAGDFDMWHRLAQKFPAVLMPQGMVWYRVHGDQEIKDREQFFYTYESLKVEYLTSPDCPLDKETVQLVLRKDKKGIYRRLLGNIGRLNVDVFKINWKNLQLYRKAK